MHPVTCVHALTPGFMLSPLASFLSWCLTPGFLSVLMPQPSHSCTPHYFPSWCLGPYSFPVLHPVFLACLAPLASFPSWYLSPLNILAHLLVFVHFPSLCLRIVMFTHIHTPARMVLQVPSQHLTLPAHAACQAQLPCIASSQASPMPTAF